MVFIQTRRAAAEM